EGRGPTGGIISGAPVGTTRDVRHWPCRSVPNGTSPSRQRVFARALGWCRQLDLSPSYLTNSLRSFRGCDFTTVRAGLALIIIGSPVAGLRPMRSGVAGF